MLNQIRIQRFKNISDITLHLDRVNIIVGSNNAGKSSIIQAIQFGVSVAQTTSLERTARWVDDRLSTSIAPTQLVYSPLRDVYALAPGGVLKESEGQAIRINLQDETNNRVEIMVRKGRNKNVLISLNGRTLGESLQSIEEPYSIFVPGLAGIPSVEEYKTPGIVRKAAARGDANNVFRNVLWLLRQHEESWNRFLEDFHNIFPDLNINVNFNPERDEHINAIVHIGDEVLPIDAAGTGVLQAIQILSYVNVYRPKILILDEPDSHLHPNNQRRLARMLVGLAEERKFQIILTTHSRHLLDELSQNSKIHWIRKGDIVQAEDNNEVNILMELGALDKGDLFQNVKCVVLTEDLNTRPIVTILSASGFNIDEVDIWSYKGCSKIDTAFALAAFVRKHSPSTKILLHRDRDYFTEEEIRTFRAEIEAANIYCFVTTGTDAESHFLNVEHIHYLYPTKWLLP